MKMTKQQQRPLIAKLRRIGSAGSAETQTREELLRRFLPVAEHLRALSPDVVLVVGPRGAGKTELVRLAFGEASGVRDELPRFSPALRLPKAAESYWLQAHPAGTHFPSSDVLRAMPPSDARRYRGVWLAYLVRILRDQLSASTELEPLYTPDATELMKVLEALRPEVAIRALDQLEHRLERDGRWLFLAYDELDTLGGGEWSIARPAIDGLVGFWAEYNRRWRRIRPKIFMRPDFFSRMGATGGADLAKLIGNRVEIEWSDAALYSVLVKHVANEGPELADYVAGAKVRLEKESPLGWVPEINRAAGQALVERMVGPYMGANKNKGLSHRWLLDHIRDGRGVAVPRSLIRLVEKAADLQYGWDDVPRTPRLLTPQALRVALDGLSREHVLSCDDEWPWLLGLKERLDRSQVPFEEPDLRRILADRAAAPWGAGGRDVPRPPGETPSELIDYLVEIGIMRRRTSGKIDVPDLYLAGLGLVRKGGVTRGER